MGKREKDTELTSVKKQYSLKIILLLGFMFFTVTPLLLMTFFSSNLSKDTLNSQIQHRIEDIESKLHTRINDIVSDLKSKSLALSKDKSFVYYASSRQRGNLVAQVQRVIGPETVKNVLIFDRQGQLYMALQNRNFLLERNFEMERQPYALSSDFVNSDRMQFPERSEFIYVGKTPNGSYSIRSISNILTEKGRMVGFMELNYHITIEELLILKEDFGAELVLSLSNYWAEDIRPDLKDESLSTTDVQTSVVLEKNGEQFVSGISGSNKPIMFSRSVLDLGTDSIITAVGLDQTDVIESINKIRKAFWFVFLILLLVLLAGYFWINYILIRPLDRLLGGINALKMGEKNIKVTPVPPNELGQVMRNFNTMVKTTQDTQAQLVHQAKMASLGQLVAGVAHELNNPIGFIYANMKHLREYSKSLFKIIETAQDNPGGLKKIIKDEDFEFIKKDLPKLITSCEEGSERTKNIVVGLRNFSRLNEADLKQTNIKEDIDNTLNILSGELKNRIKINKNYNASPLITCHPSQINQVIMNVIANAAQSIDGEGEITINLNQDSNNVIIEVVDTGIGMDEETTAQVFDPFFTTKKVGDGTGLGLSISYGIIEKHGGNIEVESKLGKGTKFTIRLPKNYVSDV